jgi:hypothetical protein
MSKIQFIQVTPEQLHQEILTGIKSQLNTFIEHFHPKPPDEYLTRQETADFFKVDISTLWHWKKRGFLTPYGAEGIVRYKRSDVEQAMIKLK